MKGYNQRTGRRSNSWKVDALVSDDMEQWLDVEVQDISSGGLNFLTDQTFETGSNITFKLHIHSAMLDYRIMVMAEVRRHVGVHKEMNAYGVMFKDLSSDDRIRLDVLVNHDDGKMSY